MPDDKPQIPPPRFAVREFTTPNFADGFFTEVFKRTDPAYMALPVPKRGMLYSAIVGASPQVIAQFPNLYFLKESRLGISHEWVIWMWGTDPAADDTYNAAVDYTSAVLAFPEFTRTYDIRRDVYDANPTPLAIGAALRAVLGALVTVGGADYSAATTLAFSGGGGSGATAVPVIAGGVIISVIVTNAGSGYTSVPTLTATDTTGSGAVLSVLLQPSTAILIEQKKQEFPDDHPLRNEYVRVVRKFEILPGPIVTEETILGDTGIPVLTATQKVAATSLFTTGEFLPAAINVSSITTGTTVTVTLASDHGLPVGAYVNFSGTNSTPPLNSPLRIEAVPDTDKVTITPASPVTVAGTAAGTMQSKYMVAREIRATENGNVKLKVDRYCAALDLTTLDENVGCWEEYPFPNYLKAFILYNDTAFSRTTSGSGSNSNSASWSGAPGFPTQGGYRGPCPAFRLRFFFDGPPPDSFASDYSPTIIIPSIGTFVIKGGSTAYSRSLTNPSDTSYSTSNSFRAAVTGEGLTGPSPAITYNGVLINISSVTIATPTLPIITVASVHGMSPGAFVVLLNTGTTPSIDGVWQTVSIPTTSSFQIQPPKALTAGSGAVGQAQILTTTGTSTAAGIATAVLDIPVSTPAKIIGQLTITAIGTGATPLITLNGDHYLRVGQRVGLSGTNCTPVLSGIFKITSVPAPNQIRVTPLAAVTGSGSAGTLQNYITDVRQPKKLPGTALWDCYVFLIAVLYTSGDAPP